MVSLYIHTVLYKQFQSVMFEISNIMLYIKYALKFLAGLCVFSYSK